MRTVHLIILFVSVLALTACGKKGPVRPREERLPQVVQSAKILQRGDSFQLQWKMPEHNQDGSPLTDLDNIEIERLFSAEGEFCAECPDPWPLIARIHPQLPAPAHQIRNLYLFSDQGARVKQVARYRLIARNKQGDLGEPLILKRSYRTPVAEPTELQIDVHDKSIELRWQAPTVPFGATLVGYQVYRRAAGMAFSPLPTNLRPLKTAEFSDFGLDNNRTYFYRVRGLFDFTGDRVESLPSQAISARPVSG